MPALATNQTAPIILSSVTLNKVEYWHKDHLGSLVATTDQAGAVTARYSYDPFGKRRTASGNYDANGVLVIDWNSGSSGTDRGYTGHEHLDDVGIIHMNGRLYDPLLGRFLQVDPLIQDPLNLQNFNRYGYCYNNPLVCTDPTGQVFGLDDLIIAAIFIYGAEQSGAISHSTARAFYGIVVSIYLGPGAGQAFTSGGMAQAAAAGFAGGAVSTGTLKGALVGGFSAGMFYGAGNVIGGGDFFGGNVQAGAKWGTEAGIALHGVVGCVTSVAGGGKCGPGALSAAFTKALAPATAEMTNGDRLGGTIVSAVVGGTASVLGGGKFANGAQTGAFSYLFNDASHVKANRAAGIAFETATVEAIEATGVTVARNVELKFVTAGGELVTAIADFMYLNGDKIMLGEVKYGLNSRFSPGQKVVYDALIMGKDVAINASALERAVISDAVYKTAIREFRLVVSEAAGRAARQAAIRWGIRALGVVTLPVQVAIELATFSKDAN